MSCAGFLNLPNWHHLLAEKLVKLDYADCLRLPVLGREAVEKPWCSLDSDDFRSVVEIGIDFGGASNLNWLPNNVITSDPEFAINRLLDKKYSNTFFSAAVGSIFPFLTVLSSPFLSNKTCTFIVQNDSVTSFILSQIEKKNKTMSEAITEAQWEGTAPSNPNNHLHGTVSRNRLALQIAEVFNLIVPAEKIETKGVATLSKEDVKIASKLGFSIRLLGIAEVDNNQLKAIVEPCVIPDRFLLAQVRGGSEIIYSQAFDGTAQVYSSTGTDFDTTVRGIVYDLQRIQSKNIFNPPFKKVETLQEFLHKFFIKISFIDIDSTLCKILNILSDNKISVEKITHLDTDVSSETMIIVTDFATGKSIDLALASIRENVKLVNEISSYRFITRK